MARGIENRVWLLCTRNNLGRKYGTKEIDEKKQFLN
jgi:hypothetical protein